METFAATARPPISKLRRYVFFAELYTSLTKNVEKLYLVETTSKTVLELKEDITPENYVPGDDDPSDSEEESRRTPEESEENSDRGQPQNEQSSPQSLEPVNQLEDLPSEGHRESARDRDKSFSSSQRSPMLAETPLDNKFFDSREKETSSPLSRPIPGSPISEPKESPNKSKSITREEVQIEAKPPTIIGMSSKKYLIRNTGDN